MAWFARKEREGFRDAFYCWTTIFIRSDYNFILPVLAKTLTRLIVPWNSSITQTARAKRVVGDDPGQNAIYKITFGAREGMAEKIAMGILEKMTEMEERMQKLQFLHEPEGWFADENQE